MTPTSPTQMNPWAALWSLILGFFMILVDTTIVSVANPSIMQGLGTTMNATLWATSAYLLAYAVPLLITGRLGDRFGPKRTYLVGLTVFTASSLACGLALDIDVLIISRVFQGLGASLMTPQTMATITRIFPPAGRGAAMAVWGVTAGVATLVGPILGGLLLDTWGWEWIFFINVPVGIIGFFLALRFVPTLETSAHRFDWIGVLLSAVGMFLLVFGIQEGETFAWGVIWGPVSVWGLIITGVVVLVLFVVWQRMQSGEPLVPLGMFRDRNFSVGSATIVTVGLAVTSLSLPLMFFFQMVLGLTPTQSALMLSPMAVLSVALARPVGRLIDRGRGKLLASLGLFLQVVGITMYIVMFRPDTPVWVLLLPNVVLGVANACMWGPLASMTTYRLAPEFAGAGSGVYNTARQIGAVLGAAAMAALMSGRIAAELGAGAPDALASGDAGQTLLPDAMREGFAAAMAQSLIMPAAVILVGAMFSLAFASRSAR